MDPNIKPLEKISEKIQRKSKKVGAPNVLYLRSSIENLPPELTGIANQVFVLFPWGTLLAAILGRSHSFRRLREICAPGASFEAVFSLEFLKDRSELQRLGIEAFSIEALENQMTTAYHAAGFAMQLHPLTDLSEVRTTWGRRLAKNPERSFLKLTGQRL